jgi:hypothetical protein
VNQQNTNKTQEEQQLVLRVVPSWGGILGNNVGKEEMVLSVLFSVEL